MPDETADMTPEEALEAMTVDELTAEAKERGFSGYSSLDKAGLVDLLSGPDPEPEPETATEPEPKPKAKSKKAAKAEEVEERPLTMTETAQARMNEGIAIGQAERAATLQRNLDRKAAQHESMKG